MERQATTNKMYKLKSKLHAAMKEMNARKDRFSVGFVSSEKVEAEVAEKRVEVEKLQPARKDIISYHVFRVPLQFPRYAKADYEKMAEWELDRLLREYGLPVKGDLHQKRLFAMGAFLWPHQMHL